MPILARVVRTCTVSALVLLASAAAPSRAIADEAPLTLDAAVALAVRHAPLLAADGARIDAARSDAIRAGRLPDPELAAGISNLPVQGPGAWTVGADSMTMRTVGVFQRLPSGAARAAERAMAQARIGEADAARTAGMEDVRRAAAAAWIARWASERKRALLAELRADAGTAVRASRARLAGGTGSAAEALATRAGKHPDWRFGASYGRRANGWPDMVTFEVAVSLPLFARNRQDPAISARYAERDAVSAEHEDARRAQRAVVERALAEWEAWTRQVRRDRTELLPLAHDRSSAALAAYRGGAPLQPWLDARRDEVAARIEYADALGAWGRAWAALAYLLPNGEDTP